MQTLPLRFQLMAIKHQEDLKHKTGLMIKKFFWPFSSITQNHIQISLEIRVHFVMMSLGNHDNRCLLSM